MEKVEKIEDLKIGDIVTIAGCKLRFDRSFMGDLMTVTVIDAPFICADIEQHEHYHKTDSEWENHSLCFDEYVFLRPSTEYVDAIHDAKRAYQEQKAIEKELRDRKALEAA